MDVFICYRLKRKQNKTKSIKMNKLGFKYNSYIFLKETFLIITISWMCQKIANMDLIISLTDNCMKSLIKLSFSENKQIL